jgi:hypothetical protein
LGRRHLDIISLQNLNLISKFGCSASQLPIHHFACSRLTVFPCHSISPKPQVHKPSFDSVPRRLCLLCQFPNVGSERWQTNSMAIAGSPHAVGPAAAHDAIKDFEEGGISSALARRSRSPCLLWDGVGPRDGVKTRLPRLIQNRPRINTR